MRLARVSHRYPGSKFAAISNVSFDVERGDLILITGRSGSGKTTLLRTMNGLVPHFHGGRFSGTVKIDGISTLESKPRNLAPKVGFVGQDPESQSVIDRVEDDIAFTLENLAIPAPAMRKRVEEVMDALGLAHLRSRKLDSLSGGERQRVAIASAISAMPSYLVLDEPTSQLDPQSAEEVIGAILRLRDEGGISVVLAEHRLERVLQYGDRIAHLHDGKVNIGDPQLIGETGLGPPVVAMGIALGLRPLPLELRTARKAVSRRNLTITDRIPKPPSGDMVGSLRGVAVSLGKFPILHHIDLELRQGELIVVMGRNGSGKTTLLRTIAGLQEIRSGKIQIASSLGFLPQNPDSLLYRETVAQEIATTLRLNSKPSRRTEVQDVAEHFGIRDLLNKNPRDLSGGERTMVSLAAAAAAHPQTVLLDEPTRGMDSERKVWLSSLLHRWASQGRTVVVSTHDVELAAMVASRVVIMSEGEIIVDSAPEIALSGSLTFSTQMNKVFGDPRILTLDDALKALAGR